jgi:hypothetical protein
VIPNAISLGGGLSRGKRQLSTVFMSGRSEVRP